MTTTPALFKARFVEFAATSDARVQIFLDDAALDMNVAFWGRKYDLGQTFLAAHLLSVSDKTATGSRGSVNNVLSRTVDGAAATYANPHAAQAATDIGDVFISATSYGQQYLNLRNHLGSGACVV
jgi:hypothetical protein